ncbi:MAG: S9 family peptidase [Geminicoccaceae bacterium]
MSDAPPVAAVRQERRVVHGQTLEDAYAWLRDPAYPQVERSDILDHLKAENAYAQSWLDRRSHLTDTLFAELKGRIKDDDTSVPSPYGPYRYGWRFAAGAQYRTWYRAPRDGGEEQVILDEPAMAADASYFMMRSSAVSRSHELLAFSTDRDGSERYQIEVKRLADDQPLADRITNTAGGMVWAGDSHLFYVELSPELRPFRVRRHRLGDDPTADALVFEEADPGFFVSVGRTLSGAFMVINTGDHVTNEVRLVPLAEPEAEPLLIAPRETDHEYDVDHQNGPDQGRLLILTNDRHKNRRLVSAPVSDPGRDHWQEEVAASDEVYLLGHTCFDGFTALVGRERGLSQVWIRRDDGESHAVRWPDATYSAGLGTNMEYQTDRLRLRYSSLTTPATVFDYHLADRRLETLKVQEIPSGYDRDAFVAERLEATAPDGTLVPISVVRPKDFPLDGRGKLHLYAYGSYGHGMDPSFSTGRLSLLERGMAFAIAHVRGGDEMGYHWYEAGKREHKENTFRDFIACAEHLIDKGYARAGNVSIEGGSAGGMLVGAVLNMRADLWGCALALVPFVDVVNTMLDETLPLTPIEWPEWGDPLRDEAAFRRLLGYSPYENVSAQSYPPIFVSAGLSDPRVTYWEPAKWVAKLRATKTDDSLLLLKTEMGAGHFGQSGRYDSLKDRAEHLAFLLTTMGLAGEDTATKPS